MKNMRAIFVFFLILGLYICVTPVAAVLPGGGLSVIFQCSEVVSSSACNANDATVSINGVLQGTIQNGVFEIPYENGFSTFRISKSGYSDKSGTIPEPLIGQTGDITIDATLTPAPVGSGKGWFKVHSNVDGASVAFDGITKGTINSGVFTLEVSTTGTPYTSYSVSKSGYVSYDGSIFSMPVADQTIDLYATLNPVPTATTTQPTTIPTTVPAPIGGDAGWYKVIGNVNGADIYFDSEYMGAITDGTRSVQVYSTGTPYKTYRVEKTGYVTATGSLPAAPAKGQTKDVYVTLNPVSTPAPVPVGSGKGYYAVHCNVEGAEVLLDATSQGVITNGVLTVTVATTGTPFRTYEVKKAGYVSSSGSITQYPAAGQTNDIYTTLSPVAVKTNHATAVPTPVPTTQSPLPFLVIIGSIAGAVLIFSTRGK